MRKSLYLYPAIGLLILLGAWWHAQAGYSLPFPCGDEVVFYYPAQALAKYGTLASPHLLPNRTLHWMPPGYMAMLALWLQTVGEGLGSARWMSFFFAACALVASVNFWVRMRLPQEGLLLLAVAFLSRHWVVVGNMARMEGLLLCLIFTVLWALWQGKTLAAAGIALLALTVHPNAVYFILGTPLLALLAPKRSATGFLNLSLGFLGIAVVGLYGFYVLNHLQDFIYDWRWQFTTRSSEGIAILLLRPDQAAFFAGLSSLAYWAWRGKRRNIGFVLTTATLFWMLRVLGQGWSYGIFNVIALTLVLGCALAWAKETAWPFLSRYVPSLLAPALPYAAVTVLILGLSAAKIYTLPLIWRAHYHWMGMTMQTPAKPYLTSADRQAVLASLYQQLPHRQNKLYFMPEGDGIALTPADTGRLLHVFPIFGKNLPEYLVVHRSSIADFYEDAFQETLLMLPDTGTLPTPFYTRQGTERWYLIPVKDKYPPYILLENDPIIRRIKN